MSNLKNEIGQSSKIRVCIVAPSLDILGGQSRQAALLLAGLRDEPTLEVDFIPHNPRLPGVLRKLQSIKYVRTVVTTLLYFAIVVIRLPRYDVVHLFSASYYSYLLSVMPVILIAKAYGKPVILHYHSGEAEDHLEHWPRTTVPIMRLTGTIVVPSNYLVGVFARFGLQGQVISNIVDLARFRFRDRAPLHPVFLSSRLLEPLYNVGCILRAFASIQSRYPQASLTIAADGSLRSHLEQLASDLGLLHTEFIGRVPFEAMPDLYDAADIYLNASDIDNTPGSILECFAAGLLVVTTEAGGIPYILEHEKTGLMVKCGDHEALATSAIRLLGDPVLAARLALNARESVLSFTRAAVCKEWLSLYRKITPPKIIPRGLVSARSYEAITHGRCSAKLRAKDECS
jgi:glycosyltransferase involved in cell wall biosynthesis